MVLNKFTKNMDLMALCDSIILRTAVVSCCQTAVYRTDKSSEQSIPFLFYRSAVFVGHLLAADSNKDLYIGENYVKKVEMAWATIIQCLTALYSLLTTSRWHFDYVPYSSQCNT